MESIITLNPGGSEEKKVPLSEIKVPDLWHVAQMMEGDMRYSLHAKDVLDCWAMAHSLVKHIRNLDARDQVRVKQVADLIDAGDKIIELTTIGVSRSNEVIDALKVWEEKANAFDS